MGRVSPYVKAVQEAGETWRLLIRRSQWVADLGVCRGLRGAEKDLVVSRWRVARGAAG